MANLPIQLTAPISGTLQPVDANSVKAIITKELKALPNFKEIEATLNGSGTLDFMLGILESNYQLNNYYNFRAATESTLQTATLPRSKYNKARELGYRINRANSPRVSVKYDGIPTITVTYGTVVGKTKAGLDLVYFGKPRKIERLDVITVSVGKYRFDSTSVIPSEDFKETQLVTIKPGTLTGIDNVQVELEVNSVLQEKTLFPEDFIVLEKWADFSISRTESNVMIVNTGLRHGLFNTLSMINSPAITIHSIETNGKIPDLKQADITTIPTFIFVEVTSLGTDAETDEQIVNAAPLMYSLLRRAVTEQDLNILIRNQPLIFDASVSFYQATEGVWEVTLSSVFLNQLYTVNVNGNVYNHTSKSATDTPETVIKALYSQLKTTDTMHTTLVKRQLPLLPDINGLCKIEDIKYSWHVVMQSNSSRILPTVTVTSSLILSNPVPQVPPECCVMQVNYVHENSGTNPAYLTKVEYDIIDKVIKNYKMAGLALYWRSATPLPAHLNYSISLLDNADEAHVLAEWAKFLVKYNRRVDRVLDTTDLGNEFMSHVNSLNNRNTITRVTDLVLTTYDASKDKYLLLTSNLSIV
jgi:hypothetical protein